MPTRISEVENASSITILMMTPFISLSQE